MSIGYHHSKKIRDTNSIAVSKIQSLCHLFEKCCATAIQKRLPNWKIYTATAELSTWHRSDNSLFTFLHVLPRQRQSCASSPQAAVPSLPTYKTNPFLSPPRPNIRISTSNPNGNVNTPRNNRRPISPLLSPVPFLVFRNFTCTFI